MIIGAHTILYADDAAKARAFFRDTLGFDHVDAGEGWLIFALPPAEMGIHPQEKGGKNGHELYLMCDDVEKTVADLKRKGVVFTQPVLDHGWGLLTSLRIPGGGDLGLYQPRHPLAAKGLRAVGSPKAAKSRAKTKAKKKGVTAASRPKGRVTRKKR